MKKVIFICLLAIAGCLSASVSQHDATNSPAQLNEAESKPVNPSEAKPSVTLSGNSAPVPHEAGVPHEGSPKPAADKQAYKQEEKQATDKQASEKQATDKPASDKQATDKQASDNKSVTDNKTDDNKTKPDDTKGKVDPPKDDKDKTTEKPTDKPAAAPTVPVTPAPADSKTTVTPATKPTEGPKPTESPKPTEAPKPTAAPSKEGDTVVTHRGFDGASFVGGIILTLGLLAIGFMGFKYYRNQTERNYHTL